MGMTRYILALLMLMALPCAILYWFIIHPFARFWRKFGALKTQLFCSVILLMICSVIFAVREPLLRSDWFPQWPLISFGTAMCSIGIYFEYRCRKHLKLSTLLGGPELSPDYFPNQLLNKGIYAEVRHPRYLAATFGCIGASLILNYPTVYAFTVFFVLMLYPLILIEERELRDRFGAQYSHYAKSTPMLIPKWWPGRSR